MRLARPRIVTHTIAGILPSGSPHTVAAETQTEFDDLVLGNGAAHDILLTDGTRTNVDSLDIPIALGNPANFLYPVEMKCLGASIVYVHLHVISLVGIGSLDVLVEFQDPDYPAFWFPSAEGVARTAARAAHIVNIGAVGDYIIATREEHPQLPKVRFGFGGQGNAANATEVWVSWSTHTHASLLTPVTN